MRYVFADLGAYTGDSIIKFMRKRNLPLEPKYFNIYAFEPNPDLFTELHPLMERFDNIMSIDTGAAWVKDEVRQFAVDKTATPLGSTLMPGKVNIWDRFDKYEVHCFDFSEWIKQFKNDYVIVKMDIEGAEFPVLEKMLADGTASIMDQLWVEMHPNKVREYTTTDSKKLLKRVKKAGVKVSVWH